MSFFWRKFRNTGNDGPPGEPCPRQLTAEKTVAANAAQPDQEALAGIMAGLGLANQTEPLYMLKEFLSTKGHLTVPVFQSVLAKKGRDLTESQCAEALELFLALGFAEKRFTEDGQAVYEHDYPGGHHDHLICTKCGAVKEFHDHCLEHNLEKAAQAADYLPLRHRLVVYGLCPECRKERGPQMPLTQAVPGEVLTVCQVTGDDGLRRHLCEMGIGQGDELYILGESQGAILVMVKGARLALGADVAGQITVSSHNPLPGHHHKDHKPCRHHHRGGRHE